MKKLLFVSLFASIFLVSCKKDGSDNDGQSKGMNTWTFKVNGTTYKGELYWDAILNTLLQSNNTYTFSIVGSELNSDREFRIVLSLADLTFTQKNYQSGISSSDHITSFYFSRDILDYIFHSDNIDSDAVLNYKVESFNQSTSVLVLTFSGNVEDENGNIVPLTDGKVTCKVENM